MECSWSSLYWILGSLLVAVQIQLSHQQRISGPNVCNSGRFGLRRECCPGWILQPRLHKCIVPVCDRDCGDGFCMKPNVCSCPNGELSKSGCPRRSMVPGGVESRLSPYGDLCEPACENAGQCGSGGRCVCPYGFLGRTCQTDYRTGPCYSSTYGGVCSDEVPGVYSTKTLCCATVGQAWGTTCEPCNGMACPKGFVEHMRIPGECVDIDECLVLPGVCGDGTCTNEMGSYTCQDTGTPISQNATTEEQEGSTTGLCFTYGNNGTCSLPVKKPITKELCCATIGQGWGEACESCADLESQCVTGFRLQENGRCFDINECDEVPRLCKGGTCRNVEGSFRCEAKGAPVKIDDNSDRGLCFTYEKSGTCSLEVPGFASSLELCCSTLGQGWGTQDDCRSCSEFKSSCDRGYIPSISGCKDVNECELVPDLCQNGTCQNTEGGFLCQATGTPVSAGSSDGGSTTGLCFAYENNGTCSLSVEKPITKELCCATIGQGWGEACESCADLESQCVTGFRLQENGRCLDINECDEVPRLCKRGTCRNVEGSFRCEAKGAPVKIDYNSDSGLCFAYEKSGTCSLEVPGFASSLELCCSTLGKGWGTQDYCESCSEFKSSCDRGYIPSISGCKDVNECELVPELCQNGTCQNTEGSFLCQATGTPVSAGFSDGGSTTGLCFAYENNGTCSLSVEKPITKELCCATIGQGWGEACESCADLETQCQPGFRLQENGRCLDINECDEVPRLCKRGTCRNVEGSFRCEAKGAPVKIDYNSAYEKSGTCSLEVPGFATSLELCCSTLGQGWGTQDYCESCSEFKSSCDRGYIPSISGCKDVNECELVPDLCQNGTCQNTEGSFLCQDTGSPLSAGSSGGDSGLCFTFESSGVCSVEIPGFYTSKELCCTTVGQGWGTEESCEPCSDHGPCDRGYMFVKLTRSCVDINECELMPGLCGPAGRCSNIEGSFRCQTTGNALITDENQASGLCFTSMSSGGCSEEIPWFFTSKELCCRTVGQGWGADEASCESCSDIDISCGKGYMYEEGTTNCIDINECELMPGLCGPAGRCSNVEGYFRCQSTGALIRPTSGRPMDGSHGRPTGPCYTYENSGTCSFSVDDLLTTKELCCATVGRGWGESCETCAHFQFQCVPGFMMLPNGRCVDIDECDLMPNICNGGTCLNVEGSFRCEAGDPISSGPSAGAGQGAGRPGGRPVSDAAGEGSTATGPCFTYESKGVCTFPVSSVTTKALCCATIGKGWGDSCESCADFGSDCDSGFMQNDEGKCTDINECSEISGLCQDGKCDNIDGSFRCQAKGKPVRPGEIGGDPDDGLCFTFEKFGSCSLEVEGLYTSKDICCSTIGEGWGTQEICESCSDYISPCDAGFTQDSSSNRKCVDINECDTIAGICSNGQCQNTQGAFVCEVKGKPLSMNVTDTGGEDGQDKSFPDFEILDEGSHVGIEKIRLMQVTTDGKVQEYDVNVNLKLLEGINGELITTDAIKDKVYELAKGSQINSSEEFGLDICESLLDTFSQADYCKVIVDEAPWRRISQSGPEQNAFLHAHDAVKFSEVFQQRDEPAKVWGGLNHMEILKTSLSDSGDLAQDGFLSLPEDTKEFTTSTEIICKWLYSSPEGNDFAQTWDLVRNTTFDIFTGAVDTSTLPPSVQSTAYLLAHQVLQQVPEIDQVEVKLPTIHYYAVSSDKTESATNSKVYLPSEQSSGTIEAVVRRRQN
ncbi:uncharacterized protein [Amphiura filiformis]|uniref:uncharacterized protein n=1 Tax=Amphiura filiformis TaxID=82378 RepID=UPI003B216110